MNRRAAVLLALLLVPVALAGDEPPRSSPEAVTEQVVQRVLTAYAFPTPTWQGLTSEVLEQTFDAMDGTLLPADETSRHIQALLARGNSEPTLLSAIAPEVARIVRDATARRAGFLLANLEVTAAPAPVAKPKTLAELEAFWRRRIVDDRTALLALGYDPTRARVVQREAYAAQGVDGKNLKDRDVFDRLLDLAAKQAVEFAQYQPPRADDASMFSYHGIGLRLAMDAAGRFPVVNGLVPGGVAARSGALKPGDQLLAVEVGGVRHEFFRRRFDDSIKKLRNPVGTKLSLWVAADPKQPATGARRLDFVTEAVKLEAVDIEAPIHVTLRGVGQSQHTTSYLAIKDFIGSIQSQREDVTTAQTLAVILRAERPSALVLDLRGSIGGALSEIGQVYELFGGNPRRIRWINAKRAEALGDPVSGVAPAYSGPLVVIVDAETSGGAEVLAGAFQEQGRALVIGTRTLGKTPIRTATDLDPYARPADDGSRMRIGQLAYTIGELCMGYGGLMGVGVVPDIVLGGAPEATPPRNTSRCDKVDTYKLVDSDWRKPIERLRRESRGRSAPQSPASAFTSSDPALAADPAVIEAVRLIEQLAALKP